jgi:hypothetical protein
MSQNPRGKSYVSVQLRCQLDFSFKRKVLCISLIIARKHYCCKLPELIYVHSGVDKEPSLLGKCILINRKASFRRLWKSLKPN